MRREKMDCWNGFKGDLWKAEINVRDFIQENYAPYEGDQSFLAGPTEATKTLWEKLSKMFELERERCGVYDVDTKTASTITSHKPGYIDKELEKIVGLQTDNPLKRAIFPRGGISPLEEALENYGYKLDKTIKDIYSNHRKTHNEGVMAAYTPEIRKACEAGIITGLPDNYGRGRHIGDYRRVALYGLDFIISEKEKEFKLLEPGEMTPEVIQQREELTDQLNSLNDFREMCASYGFDVSKPAKTAQEAIQFVYFAILAAAKQHDGVTISLGRTSTFIDVYVERDLKNNIITEVEAQELIDHFIMKLRIFRFLRSPEYNELFSGDPTWITESIGGFGVDGRVMVTKTSYRYLHTLYNLGVGPEPNMTVLWSERLPETWKNYCARLSIETSSIQYENDDLMRPEFGDDYAISGCVGALEIGKSTQHFGARVNLPKALLYAINGGRDEKNGAQVSPKFAPITSEYLDYDEVIERFYEVQKWLVGIYVQAVNIIHYMHDKYAYEAFQMSLHDLNIKRYETFGIAGLAITVDSLMAIKNAKVKVIRNEEGLAVDFETTGDYVPFGNSGEESDKLAVKLTKDFYNFIRPHKMHRNAKPTMSLLTITSNVVYGKMTGSTPCGRPADTPFSPGVNPMNGRDKNGAVASLTSVSDIPYTCARDGISYTFAITPPALGKGFNDRQENLAKLLDGYFTPNGGQHLNVNVFDRSLLEDAMEHPEKYPQLTIRVSGYAVNFVKLTREQQLDVISRTINETK
nr:formate C-acetyltransferase [Anaeromicrobium sediminis]